MGSAKCERNSAAGEAAAGEAAAGADTRSCRVLGRRMAAGIGAGILLALSFPPYGLPVLLPAGIAILLLAIRGASVREALYAGFACGLTLYAATLFWLANLFGAAAISLIAIESLFPAIFCGLLVWLRRRLPAVPEWLLAPPLWTATEYYRSELFVLNFGWMGLGYGAIHARAFAAAASWIGSYGISFLIVLVGALLAAGLGRSRARSGPLALTFALWLAALLVPAGAPRPENPLRVGLVQAQPEDTQALFGLSRSAVRADVIVWPEYSYLSDPARDGRTWRDLQNLARSERCCLIFGGKDETDLTGDAYRNTAYVIGPDGRLLGKYVKNHTVHLIRDGIPGTGARPIRTPFGELGVAICFDMDYPDVARRLVDSGAEVFLVPNMDPAEWGPVQREQHRLMFEMRAAECGRWLARADVAGGTSVVGPNGRETARIRTTEAGALDGIVGRATGVTFYVLGGWLLPRLSVVAALALALAALASYRHRGTTALEQAHSP